MTLLYSLLELAHATSQNLGFAHSDDVHVSYGEETITEFNLLELRRRHPKLIRLRTFEKRAEALNGADWEWHMIGRNRELRMRVQAKRLQKDKKLKISHKVVSSGKQQIDILIADAKRYRLKPVYCFYAPESQRDIWSKGNQFEEGEEFEYGCLLTSAYNVKHRMPKNLQEIEADCVPWHYLIDRQRYSKGYLEFSKDLNVNILSAAASPPIIRADLDNPEPADEFPTLAELNAEGGAKSEREGVVETASVPDMQEADYLKRGISKLLEIDVREIPLGRWES